MSESTPTLSVSRSPTNIRSSCQNVDFETAQNIRDNLIMCSGVYDGNLARCHSHVEINNYSMCYGWSQAKPYAGYIITSQHHPNDKESQQSHHHTSSQSNGGNKNSKKSLHPVRRFNYHTDNNELVYYVNVDPVTYKYRYKGYSDPNQSLNKYKTILNDQNRERLTGRHGIIDDQQPPVLPQHQYNGHTISRSHQDDNLNYGEKSKALHITKMKSDDDNCAKDASNQQYLNQDSNHKILCQKNYNQHQVQLTKSGLHRAPDDYNKYFNDLTRLRFVDGRFLPKNKNIATNQFIER
ncbi:uncharacterized protein TRIADDRAFT_55728 [Trichoplax adhaerens]|uniref:Uncharacterized protein n=1 Tax=Trichoplax adhaerens TaxID=10228 RepID=B3RVP7_TRIAD|nr:predicted protein [Trichoplax adhaerens]EDV26033.1 predicted protein [Trichoplax adhaerens]|eukprot:XP_002112066.1 predicted protein [Trichoplax adhaerens]